MARCYYYPWLDLSDIEPAIPLMKKLGVSVVARSSRGFLTHYQESGNQRDVDLFWAQRRNGFLARHMAQVQVRGESLWDAKGNPTRRHLALIAWAYSPDAARWQRWLKNQRRSARSSM